MSRMPFDPGKLREPDTALDQLAEQVIGAAIEVHRELGPGFLESTYERALCIELTHRRIPFRVQHPVHLHYKGQEIGESRVDLLIGRRLIVELEAVETLTAVHTAQVLAYLKATRLQLGLLINFNVAALKDGIKRIVLS